jgi:Methyltransferase domain
MSPSWRTTAKRTYVDVARRSGRALEATRVLPTQPPARERRVRHWLRSLPHIYDSAALTRIEVPWWTYRAIDVVDTWLATRASPARVFEFGTGASTVWLAQRSGELHSVEHDAGFASSFEPWLQGFANVTLHVETPVFSSSPQTASHVDAWSRHDFTSYVSTIDVVGGEFDLVVIDGRARPACLDKAVPRLAPGGMIVFDNSRRRRYRAAIEASGLHEQALRGLTPTLPYPEQTSLLYRGSR